jgi:hypothetical protein
MAEMTTTPSSNGEAPLPRRTPRGLLPSTWLTRSVRVEYIGADGMAGSTDATLLELYPFGPVTLARRKEEVIVADTNQLEQEVESLDREAREALDRLADRREGLPRQLRETELAETRQREREEKRHRKHRELSPKQLRRVLEGGGGAS